MAAPPTLTRLTVEQAVEQYLDGVARAVLSGTLSATTQATYARDLAEFVALAGPGTVLDDLSADDIDELVLAYARTPDKRYTRPGGPGTRSPGTQARWRQSISRLFTHALRRGWVQANPMPDTQVRPRQRGQLDAARTALPQPAAAGLLDAPEDLDRHARADQRLSVRDTALLRLLLEVGPRVSELCALDRSDLTIPHDGESKAAAWLRIRHGKGGKVRDLPLSAATAAALEEYLAGPRPAPPATDPPARREDAERAMFVTYRGRRIQPRDVQNRVAKAVERLPAETRRRVTPHGLRHTAATLLLASGAADVKTVQALLGHASLATTGIYLDPVREEMARAVAAHPVTAE